MRLVAVGRENLQQASSGGGAPHGPTRVACGWPEMPPLVQSSTARTRLNDPTLFSVCRAFPRVLELKRVFWGARVSFGITIYVYIGSRVAFG